jgi:O-antigen/teichoic acid export membrane protein
MGLKGLAKQEAGAITMPEPSLIATKPRSRGTALLVGVKTVFAGRNNSAAALQTLVTRVLVLGLNAATSIVTARALNPAGRGEMAAIIMWPGFFSALLTLGLPSALTFNLRRHPELAAETISAGWLLTLAIGLATGIAGFFFVPAWLTQYPHSAIVYARWMLLASPVPILLYFGRNAMEASGNFFASNLNLWAAPFLTLIWLLVLVAFGAVNPLSSGLAYIIGSVPPGVFLLARVYSTYRPRLRNVRASLRRLLHFGLRAWGIDLLNALAVSEVVLVVHFLSPAGMGTYVVAASLARVLGVFQTSAVIVLYPRIAAKAPADVIALTGFTLRVTTFCAAAGAVVTGALGPILLRSVYGASYADLSGVLIFRLLLAEVVLSGATQVIAQAYLALERPGSVTAIQALGVGIGWLVMPWMIKEFGGMGAPLALLASSIIRFTLTLLLVPRLLKGPLPGIWLKREDLCLVAARLGSLTASTSTVRT